MSDEKKADKKKDNVLDLFRAKLKDPKQVKAAIAEGIKHTNGKVRSLAIKWAVRTEEHEFVKKNILPLINSDKSKKVLRTISDKIYRKELAAKLKTMIAKKITKGDKAEAAPEVKAEAPKA